jgi:CARDB
MFDSTPVTVRPIATLLALAFWSSTTLAQTAGPQQPGAIKGFDPQPDPPGKPAQVTRLAGGLAITAATDVTYWKGVMIGQTFAPWSTLVTVPESQAYAIERGKCAYRIRYGIANLGSAPTLTFKNTLSADASVVSTNDSLLLSGHQLKEVDTHAWLSPGTYNLILHLDVGNTVLETNESNNAVRVRLTVSGPCEGQLGNLPKVPGEEKAHVPFVPPGTPNTADQTDDKPAPQAHSRFLPPGTVNAADQTDEKPAPQGKSRFLPPGTVNAADQTNEKPAPHAPAGQAGYGGPDTKGSATP